MNSHIEAADRGIPGKSIYCKLRPLPPPLLFLGNTHGSVPDGNRPFTRLPEVIFFFLSLSFSSQTDLVAAVSHQHSFVSPVFSALRQLSF